MKKKWWFLLLAALAGLATGAANALYEQRTSVDLFFPEDFVARQQSVKATPVEVVVSPLAPRVEIVGDATFDFGSMERNSKQRHIFRIKNVGASDLTLESGRTTCKCTVSEISLDTVPPGKVSEITVEWTGKTTSLEPDFFQTVNVKTNDPDHKTVVFEIQGYVTETIRALPDELVVGNVSSNTGSGAEFRLYGFRSDSLDILETTLEFPETAGCFDVSYEPLPSEEVEKEKGATCGQLARVTIKPGLPVGPINQTIRIHVQVEKEAVVELPILGQARSDIRVASSAKFNSNRNLLSLGALKRTETVKETLRLYVTGDHRHETHFSVGRVDPSDYLKVEIGPPKELNNGKTIQFFVTIEIPAGGKPINRMGTESADRGLVVLETTHPQTKQVPIHVKFSVE